MIDWLRAPIAAQGDRKLTRKTTGAKKAPAKKPATKKAAPRKKAAAKTEERAPIKKKAAPPTVMDEALLERIRNSLDDDKAEDIVTIDMGGRSSLADAIVVATGRSSRHVASIAEHLARRLKEAGYGTRPVNGAQQGDWVLVDAGDVIVHVFRAEVRDYYDLEGMWSVDEPKQRRA
ncbi:MAG TPA: ribosome silencing factor [Rhizomicrobium sp.]|nr:ribosome silencing factor [Rhizomicrobium sp.]